MHAWSGVVQDSWENIEKARRQVRVRQSTADAVRDERAAGDGSCWRGSPDDLIFCLSSGRHSAADKAAGYAHQRHRWVCLSQQSIVEWRRPFVQLRRDGEGASRCTATKS
jgi:hypothetical protein